ncbi:class I SAM-dependent methyltransferase [Halobacterium bonnevillei]|uniref:Methyltransferase domain-containing protein n=1 Tax=Halobacterium bonnevillei TaxID=2692200 RepID=A0A6B0SEC9_9EURY|nr:class I SAM-dependent methyltransferase [Halobacterium bonnevillei]MXR19076.1 methyltransferase domain-containing protein [Halobacterium bonnevillei]
MSDERYNLVKDYRCGYFRLDPIPTDSELSEFYQSDYPELLEDGELADDVSRLLQNDEAAKREREWRRTTWYSDYKHIFEQEYPNAQRVLDIGCGTGEFLTFMENHGYDTVGIEPSGRIGKAARTKGLEVYETTAEEFAISNESDFDLITMFNVLEHVPNPSEVIQACDKLLSKDGMLIVKVPNEFNPFQIAAQKLLDLDQWWVNAPTHIFYFDFTSLATLLSDCGFKVHSKFADFPMSQFLLMGDNYVKSDSIGSNCHARRVKFEQALPDEDRRSFYTQLAHIGVGRNCTLFATAE